MKTDDLEYATGSELPEIRTSWLRRNRAWLAAVKSKPLVIGCLIYVVIVILTAILAPEIAPYDPTAPATTAMMQGPSWAHLLGTDQMGRDTLSRLIWGSRVTIVVGAFAVVIGLGLGTIIGVLAGFLGRWVDNLFMRVMDIMLAIPGILLALAIVAILGPSLTNAMIAIGIGATPSIARLIRSSVLSVKSTDYVLASRMTGARGQWIMVRHVLPNILSTLVVYGALSLGGAILDTSGLSFIGLGAQPPTPEWGTMLGDAQGYLAQAWWLATFPGLAITLLVLSINLLGDALRDYFDPKEKR